MARLSKDIIVVSQPVRKFPNGDYFYLELCRKNSRYECVVRMFCFRKPDAPVTVARGESKTIQESEERCYQIASARCPSFPKPPYFSRSKSTRRVEPVFPNRRYEAQRLDDQKPPKRNESKRG